MPDIGLYANSESTTTEKQTSQSIPYKTEKAEFSELILRAVIVFIFVIVLVIAGLYALNRFFPGAFPKYRSAASGEGKMVQVLAIQRLTPKTTLFVISYEDRQLLLAQSGEAVTLLDSKVKQGSVDSSQAGEIS